MVVALHECRHRHRHQQLWPYRVVMVLSGAFGVRCFEGCSCCRYCCCCSFCAGNEHTYSRKLWVNNTDQFTGPVSSTTVAMAEPTSKHASCTMSVSNSSCSSSPPSSSSAVVCLPQTPTPSWTANIISCSSNRNCRNRWRRCSVHSDSDERNQPSSPPWWAACIARFGRTRLCQKLAPCFFFIRIVLRRLVSLFCASTYRRRRLRSLVRRLRAS